MKNYSLSKIDANQSILSSFERGETQFSIKLKYYIQPFEKLLASAELRGLTGHNCCAEIFSKEAPDLTILDSDVDVFKLEKRVAYWELIGTNKLKPSLQVLYENSQDWGKSISPKPNEISTLHKRRRLRYGPHNLHEYRGKFFPQMVRSFLNASGLDIGDVVLDPMCGSGTTNVEVRALGMISIGLDMNPLSVKISNVKTGILEIDQNQLDLEINDLKKKLKLQKINFNDFWDEKDLIYLLKWFDESALSEIGSIKYQIENIENPIIKEFAEICLSNIIRPISWQKDADLRVRKEIREYLSLECINKYKEELTYQTNRLIPYLKLIKRNVDLLDYEIKEGDAKHVNSSFKQWKGKCNLIVTSPPYATALPYIDTDRLSLIVLGLLPRSHHRKKEFLMIGNREISEKQRTELWEDYNKKMDLLPEEINELIKYLAENFHNEKVGFRRQNLPALLSKYFLDMREALISSKKMLENGAFAFYVVGNNSTNVNDTKVEIKTDKFIWDLAESVGFRKEKFLNMELLNSRDIFRHNRGSQESILILQA